MLVLFLCCVRGYAAISGWRLMLTRCHHHPEAIVVGPDTPRHIKALVKPGQPPIDRLLYEMCVASVRQILAGRPRVYGIDTDAHGHTREVVKDIVEQLGFDVLEHVNAGNERARLRRVRPLWYCGIVVV